MKRDFSLSQTAQFGTITNLFCLVSLTLEFLFTLFFLQPSQYVSIVLI